MRLRSEPDRVGTIRNTPPPQLHSGEWWYTVAFNAGLPQQHPEGDLDSYDGDATNVDSLLLHNSFAGRDALQKLVTHLKLRVSLRSQIYALAASRTTFYAFQFKPLLKFLEARRHRLLIADEVGLGKTIEAGIIFTELRQRKPLRRVLVVPPSHLVPKWRAELRRRFDLDLQPMGTTDALDFLHRYQEEGDECQLQGILSLQSLRGRRLQERWEEVSPDLDLVVFDEAGRIRNADTLSHQAARRVCENADAVLLLTATPVQTGAGDLFNLLRLLEPEEFTSLDVFQARLETNEHVLEALRLLSARVSGRQVADTLRGVERTPLKARFLDNPIYHDILSRLEQSAAPDRRARTELQRDLTGLNVLGHVLSRTRKREVHEYKAERRAKLLTVEPTPVEREFYDRVTTLCRERLLRSGATPFAAFITMHPQRQMASCMVAMIDYAVARQQRERQSEALPDPEASDLDVEDVEDFEEAYDNRPAVTQDWASLGDLDEWRARLATHDSKWDKLLEALRDLDREEAGAKVVVFAFFKGTLRYLERRLGEEAIGCVRVDGDVPTDPDDPDRDERANRIEVFRTDPRVRVLLSSEVGDEGIDLQFAHVLVNYDLPWNPMRVEQRIGRLDRLNQPSDVIQIINLSMLGTIEDRVLKRLYDRIEIFRRSIGDLETILGEEVRKLQTDLFAKQLTQEEMDRRLEQTAEAIIRRQHHLEQLQSHAESLLQSDEFFLEAIRTARSRSRYFRGEDLLNYIRDFLTDHHRDCAIEEEIADRMYRLRVSDSLRQLVRASVPSHDLGLRLFLTRSQSGTLRLCIDPEMAQSDHHADLLTFHHPVIRAISKYYDQHTQELHPISYVRVRSMVVPPGRYAWFLFQTEVTGARPERDLEIVGFSLDGGDPLSTDASEELLNALLLDSETVAPSARKGSVSADLIRRAHDVLTARLYERFERRKRTNDALVNNLLASLRESHERTVRLRKEQIAVARERGRKETYIRGRETGLRNLEDAHQRRIAEVEATRTLGKSFDLRGAGVAEVDHGG
ncbi:MAG: SNF2-related protein [Candidatus Binatia bacterium]